MKRNEKLRDRLELGVLITFFILCIASLSPSISSDELVHEFKNPSFSGIGTSAHYLTVENQEKSRRDAIKKDIEAALNKLKETQKILH